MLGQKWTIYWNEYAFNTYLYGSEVILHSRDDVEFSNHLIPSGTVIKEWFSKTNFQLQRVEPSLPMIDGEGKYRITVNIDCPEEEPWLVRLLYFDKYDTEAGSDIIRNRVSEFKCPMKTYSYRMQLICGGVTHLHFHSIVIQEVIDEIDETERENQKTK